MQVAHNSADGNVISVDTLPRLDPHRTDSDWLLSLSLDAFTRWGRSIVGHAPRFHHDVYRRLMSSGQFLPAESPLWQEAEKTRPGTIARFSQAAPADQLPPQVSHRAVEDSVAGTTTKILCRLPDNHTVEAVLIPMHGANRQPENHHTVCVSSQVGCRMGCSFCHTAKMGLIRNLSAHEIVGQVLAVKRATGISPRNVVFMGMGEPLDNIHEVANAIRVMTDPGGLAIRHRHISVSTVGRVDVLEKWVSLGLERINLAVSLTVADDGLRNELMPVNRLHSLADLHSALEKIPLASGRHLLMSCVVIPGITDSAIQIAQLISWINGLTVMVNLIPYNPIPSRPWRAPTIDEMNAVRSKLVAAGLAVRLRVTKGDAVMAACGQLGNPAPRRVTP